jgi:hypothetical protein
MAWARDVWLVVDSGQWTKRKVQSNLFIPHFLRKTTLASWQCGHALTDAVQICQRTGSEGARKILLAAVTSVLYGSFENMPCFFRKLRLK